MGVRSAAEHATIVSDGGRNSSGATVTPANRLAPRVVGASDAAGIRGLPVVAGKSGWPWSVGSPAVPRVSPSGVPWPRVTVVTPSFNQGEFLEETIRSVLLQGYPNLQYFVMDGGSTDSSVDILRRYSSMLDWWVSERDGGQADAINKGLKRADGVYFAWLNSDDIYAPGALVAAVCHLLAERRRWVAGACRWRGAGECGEVRQSEVNRPLAGWLDASPIQQPSSLWERALHDEVGPLDETLHYVMDNELFLRFRLAGVLPLGASDIWSVLRLHTQSKTVSVARRFACETVDKVGPRFLSKLPKAERRAAKAVLATKALRIAKSLADEGEAVEAGKRILQAARLSFFHTARRLLQYAARRRAARPGSDPGG